MTRAWLEGNVVGAWSTLLLFLMATEHGYRPAAWVLGFVLFVAPCWLIIARVHRFAMKLREEYR